MRLRLSPATADGDARRGPSGFGGVPGMTGFTEAPSPGGAGSEVFHEAEVADRVECRFKDELRVAGIEGEWHIVPDGDSTELIELAKSVDMTIMGQLQRRADGAARLRPDDIVMAAGRPVLVVPYAGNFETVGKRILMAWDGTREANRALNDALPLLEEAQSAIVMFVGANERELEQHLPAIERISGHLQRHGVNRRIRMGGSSHEDGLSGERRETGQGARPRFGIEAEALLLSAQRGDSSPDRAEPLHDIVINYNVHPSTTSRLVPARTR